MLTIEDVVALCEEGVGICFRRKPHPESVSGEWDPARLEINIYKRQISSDYEFGLTILHEFIHARNDLLSDMADDDEEVEREAVLTYDNDNAVLDFITNLYRIRKPRK